MNLYVRRILARGPAGFLAVCLAATFLLGVGLVTKTTAKVNSTLQANWRGSYDLLVLPGSSQIRTQAGLVEPNFADYSTGGISQAQWKSVLGLSDVSVAAPVEFLGQLQSTPYDLDMSWAQGMTECRRNGPSAYRISYQVHSDAGPRSVLIANQSTDLIAGCPTGAKLQAFNTTYLDMVDQTQGISGTDGGSDNGQAEFDVSGAGVPKTEAAVVAVDPTQESKLLGSQAGFLRPLDEYDADPTAQEAHTLIPSQYWDAKTSLEDDVLYNKDTMDAKSYSVVPLVVSDTGYAPLAATVTQCRLSVDVTGQMKPDIVSGVNVGQEPTAAAEQAVRRAAKSCAHPVSQTYSITSKIIPFANDDLNVSMPGLPAGKPVIEEGTAGLEPTTVGSLGLTASQGGSKIAAGLPAGSPAFTLAPEGIKNPSSTATGSEATEQTYRLDGVPEPASKAKVVWAPLGTYHPGSIKDTGAASYVPLGTYAPATTTVKTGSHKGVQLQPSLTGDGVVLPAPAAITSLQAAHTLNPKASIAFIRVRVAGLGPYGPDARAKLAKVATEISKFGLQVRVMAGSSEEPVGLYVPQYFPDTKADLGWVSQDWTSVGAAVRVQKASVTGSFQLYCAVLGIAIIASAFVLASDTRRRRQVEGRQFVQLGWRRTRIARWWLSEDAPMIVLVAVAAAVSVLLSPSASIREVTGMAAICFLLLALGSPLVALRFRAPNPAAGRNGRAVSAPTALGLKACLHRSSGFAPVAPALAAAGVLVGLVRIILHNQALAAGNTRLAAVTTSNSAALQISIAVLGLASATGLALISLRIIAQRLTRESRLLRQVGWTRSDTRRYLSLAQLPPVVAGLVLAAAVTTELARHTDLSHWTFDLGWAAGAVLAAAILTTVWTVHTTNSKAWES